jgi:hypothetical protein
VHSTNIRFGEPGVTVLLADSEVPDAPLLFGWGMVTSTAKLHLLSFRRVALVR